MNPYDIIEKYYTAGSDLYNILVKHSEAVRNKALALARRHPELELDLEFIGEAAMLHDIGILETDAPGIKCFGSHRYIEHGYLGAEMMRKEGYPRHALVCERHTGTGITKEQIIANEWQLPHRDFLPETLEEKLICFADKFYSKTKHLETARTLEQVVESMLKISPQSAEKIKEWAAIFY